MVFTDKCFYPATDIPQPEAISVTGIANRIIFPSQHNIAEGVKRGPEISSAPGFARAALEDGIAHDSIATRYVQKTNLVVGVTGGVPDLKTLSADFYPIAVRKPAICIDPRR